MRTRWLLSDVHTLSGDCVLLLYTARARGVSGVGGHLPHVAAGSKTGVRSALQVLRASSFCTSMRELQNPLEYIATRLFDVGTDNVHRLAFFLREGNSSSLYFIV